MASDRPNLEVAERTEFGSRTTRRLRREGLVPGVVYSGGSEARTFSVPEREARNLLGTGAALFDLTFDGGSAEPVVVKEQQRHPVRGNLIHIDFQVVDLKQAIQSEVSIELLGAEESPGVKEGGVLEHITHSINVEALPTDIPESIAVDVSGMFIGDTLQLDSVVAPEGVEWALGEGADPGEITIATLNPPRVEEEPEVEEETELVGEDGEPIEAPEGEEAEGDTAEEAGDSGDSTATPTGSSPVDLPPAPSRRAGDSEARRPRPRGRSRQSRPALREDAPQHRLRGRLRAHQALGHAARAGEVPRPSDRGPHPARRAASRGAPARRRS